MGDIQADELDKLTIEQVQSIKDATLEFELMLRQSRQLQGEIKGGLEEYQSRITDLQSDREVIETISTQLTDISGSAQSVGVQVERLDLGLQRLALAQKEMSDIQDGLDDLGQRVTAKERQVETELNETVEQLVSEAEGRTEELVRQVRSSFEVLQEDGHAIVEKISDATRESDMLNERISSLGARLEERWMLETSRMDEKFSGFERKMEDRLRGMEEGLAGIRSTAVESLQTEVNRIRTDLDNFNLEAIAKRDEILNESKRMLEGMGDSINAFQEKSLAAENKLLRLVDDQKAHLGQKLEDYDAQWRELEKSRLLELNQKMAVLEDSIEGMRVTQHEAIETETFQSRESLRNYVIELKNTVEAEAGQVRESFRELTREEERKLSASREDLEELRDQIALLGQEARVGMRGEVEQGIHLLQESRKSEEEHLGRSRQEIQAIKDDLLDKLDDLDSRIRDISRTRQKLDEHADKRVGDISETHRKLLGDLEKRAGEMHEIHHKILADMDKRQAGMKSEQDEMLVQFSDSLDSRMAYQLAGLNEKEQELDELRENLAHLNKELSNVLRSETEEAVAHIQATRRGEEENLSRGKQEILAIREELLGRIQAADTRVSEAGRWKDRISEYVEKSRKDIMEVSEAAAADVQNRVARMVADQNKKHEDLREMGDRLKEEIQDHFQRSLNAQNVQLDEFGRKVDMNIKRQMEELEERARMESQVSLDRFNQETLATMNEFSQSTEASIADFNRSLDGVRADFSGMLQEIDGAMNSAREWKESTLSEIGVASQELLRFQEKLALVEKADELTSQLDETVEILSDRLQLAREENGKLDEYVRNFEQVRVTRKELEQELRGLESQRVRLGEVDNQVKLIDTQLSELTTKFHLLAESEEKAALAEERIQQLEEARLKLDHYFEQLSEKRRFVENAIRYIEKSRVQAKGAGETAKNLLEKMERAEIRQGHITEELQTLETRASSIQNMDSEIQKVEARFEQMDGLMIDLEKKQSQIGAMFRRTDDLKGRGEEIRVELESLLSEADEKMERLSAFYQTVESMVDNSELLDAVPEAAAVPVGAASGGGTAVATRRQKKTGPRLADWKRDSIMQLYLNHKWEADLIAEKMKLDPATVRAVIQSNG